MRLVIFSAILFLTGCSTPLKWSKHPPLWAYVGHRMVEGVEADIWSDGKGRHLVVEASRIFIVELPY